MNCVFCNEMETFSYVMDELLEWPLVVQDLTFPGRLECLDPVRVVLNEKPGFPRDLVHSILRELLNDQ